MFALTHRMVSSAAPGRPNRKTEGLLAAIALAAALIGCNSAAPSGPKATVDATVPAEKNAPIAHIFLIVMENKEYGEVIGSSSAPFINRLATEYGLAQQSYAVSHPSLPNYLALLSGSTQDLTGNCEDCSFDAPNLVDQLEAQGRSWRSYQEDVPGPCYNGVGGVTLADRVLGTGYLRRHNPFAYFQTIEGNARRCRDIVSMTTFATDLTSRVVPDFVWITPNVKHDMHDGSVADGDAWLARVVPEILTSPAWKSHGALIITWDEGTTNAGCCGSSGGGHVATIVIASDGKRGFTSPLPVLHYSVLRTIEEAWGLGLLGHAADRSTNTLLNFLS